MPGETKEGSRKKLRRKEDDDRTLQSMKQELKPHNKCLSSLSKRKISKCSIKGNGNVWKSKMIVNKAIAHKAKTSKKPQSSSGLKHKGSTVRRTKENDKPDGRDVKRRRRKKRKISVQLDEASRLQRKTRYLLVKIKLEQNLIDAYSTEGWKGQSREKIKPEKELERAKKQIVMYKLGIREALHQLDLLSSEGRICDSVVASDGSVHHEHIICAKCKLREAFPDNDIILCDGTCNRALHQKCLDPPLPTENSEDVFKEEANIRDDGNSMYMKEEWPSDDSEDDDYDPYRIERTESDDMSRSESNGSGYSSDFLGSLECENGIFEERRNGSFDNNNSFDLVGVDSAEGEVVHRPRKRVAVDYTKLYDEMFGKNAIENEEMSEDEEWGPMKRKRKVKETDAASTLMTLGDETEEKNSEEFDTKTKRPIFRLPHNTVEKLRLVFAENELPARSLRMSLSKQLGLEFEKVNKWFKNARYLALKARKRGRKAPEDVTPTVQETENGDRKMASTDEIALNSSDVLKTFVGKRETHSVPTSSCKKKQPSKLLLHTADTNQMTVDLGDDVSLKHLKEKAKEAKKKLTVENRDDLLEAEIEMEKLCEIKTKVENLQQVLLRIRSRRFGKSSGIKSNDSSVIFVPVAELREKR